MTAIFHSPISLALIHRSVGRLNPALPWWTGHTPQTPAHIRLASVIRLAAAVARALPDEDWAPGHRRVQDPPTPWVEWAARHRRSTSSAMAMPPGVDVRLPGTLRHHAHDGGGYGGRLLGHLASVVLDARWRPQDVVADAENALCHVSAIETMAYGLGQDRDWTPIVQSLVRSGHLELSGEAMRCYGLVEEARIDPETLQEISARARAVEAAVLEAAQDLQDTDHPAVATRRVGCTEVAYTSVDLSETGVDRDEAIRALHLHESQVLGSTWTPIYHPRYTNTGDTTYVNIYPEKGPIPWPRLYVGYTEDTPPDVLYVARPID